MCTVAIHLQLRVHSISQLHSISYSESRPVLCTFGLMLHLKQTELYIWPDIKFELMHAYSFPEGFIDYCYVCVYVCVIFEVWTFLFSSNVAKDLILKNLHH